MTITAAEPTALDLLDPAPHPARQPDHQAGVVHTVCCDPDLARCGADVTSHPWAAADDPHDCCPTCENLTGTQPTCGARWCRIRSRWRTR
jgi:hypothetical protein